VEYSPGSKAREMTILNGKKEYSWEEFFESGGKNCLQKVWRTYSDSVNKALLLRWWPADGVERMLKTDLFDEAVNEGLHPLLAARVKHVIGMDITFSVAHRARLRYPSLQTIGADVRCLPFMDSTFDLIVSNSTLDHFVSVKEIIVSLGELYRVLRPGKQMLLTFDNLANPIVLLRSILPFRLLYRLGVVPYYVGSTLGPSLLGYLLETSGFKVLEMDAMMHCPRVLAVFLARWMERHASPKAQKAFLGFLMAFERLSFLPMRFLTGHFIAVRMVKSSN
jgi:ubiquinone/menaquinone biosynthesis C-methylase UbiE